MGNSLMSRRAVPGSGRAAIHTFYSSRAWIEGRAQEQLEQVASLAGVAQVAAFPDLHPGKYGPVGCAILADRLYPALAGSDIGCGMSLFGLDIDTRRLKLNKAEKQMRKVGEPGSIDYSPRLVSEQLPPDLWTTALGTIGSGNHFCELQICVESNNSQVGTKQSAYLLVHSGSRGLGYSIGEQYLSTGLQSLRDQEADAYLVLHDQAVKWARLNRQIIAERAAAALKTDLRLITDNVHNLITRHKDGFLHRKGAAVAGGLTPLAGSRSTQSYLIDASGAPASALGSCAHGAGRKYDRHSMHGRVSSKKSNLEALSRNSFGGRVICEDKSLLIEEAPLAYKPSADVLNDLVNAKVAIPVATFHPLITFKKTRQEYS